MSREKLVNPNRKVKQKGPAESGSVTVTEILVDPPGPPTTPPGPHGGKVENPDRTNEQASGGGEKAAQPGQSAQPKPAARPGQVRAKPGIIIEPPGPPTPVHGPHGGKVENPNARK